MNADKPSGLSESKTISFTSSVFPELSEHAEEKIINTITNKNQRILFTPTSLAARG
jgi:hypothetical protein